MGLIQGKGGGQRIKHGLIIADNYVILRHLRNTTGYVTQHQRVSRASLSETVSLARASLSQTRTLARLVPQPDPYLSQTRTLARLVPQPDSSLIQTRPSSTVHQQIILRKYQCRMWYIVLSARMAYDIQCIVYSGQCIQRCRVNLFTIVHYQSIRCDRIYRKLCHSTVYSTQSTLYSVQLPLYTAAND